MIVRSAAHNSPTQSRENFTDRPQTQSEIETFSSVEIPQLRALLIIPPEMRKNSGTAISQL